MDRKVFLYSSLAFLAFTPIFLLKIFNAEISFDEHQHLYLAWSSAFFDKLVFLDSFDNHGPVYAWLNKIFLLITKPEVNHEVFFHLRLLNLFILFLTFLTLSQFFYKITKNLNALILAPWVFSLSFISSFALEVRPDNLQALFMSLALLFIYSSMENQSKLYKFLAGLALALMLMTNLKSFIIVLAFYIFLIALRKDLWLNLGYLSLGLFSGLSLILLVMSVEGSFAGYYDCLFRYNWIYGTGDFAFEKKDSLQQALMVYFKKDIYLSLFCMASMFFFIRNKAYKLEAKLLISILIGTLILFKALILMWGQYDIAFILPLSFTLSALLIYIHELIPKKIYKRIFLIAIALLIFRQYRLNFSSGLNYNREYFQIYGIHLDYIKQKLQPGETVETFMPRFAGHGFFPHASYMNFKPISMLLPYEKMLGEKIYTENYAKLLEEKKVRFIFGIKKYLPYMSREQLRYLMQNYKLNPGEFMERRTEFFAD